jgi:hypothetical protein
MTGKLLSEGVILGLTFAGGGRAEARRRDGRRRERVNADMVR